ncbi:PEP-CTERM sorting domain-containing protein [sulfur-oxidizing endosymbiont of Gigantopelta aegis]|uniref:PEP-CTERM sorting domain-containing protein n=1 Tax=sulfur-oxidizing endosymbiont of Gigantopelta aegis TaxID=2794934 RepID=UPI0018DCAD43|nr:PEP-CTERM sorting domain-containing protein [sulfur-oxidizing endosymbiont of Gigantopelta aegis]
MKNIIKVAASVSLIAFSASVFATPMTFWDTDGWTQFANDEGHTSGPGGGGQEFDAEYLYYKKDGNTLSLGLQTGFDVVDGHLLYGNKNYYAGDLALSFDGATTIGDASTYEYGVDFGLYTEGYYNVGTGVDMGITGIAGTDDAGLYNASSWSNNIYYSSQSSPFALNGGTLVKSLLTNNYGQESDSYFRTVSFDITGLGLGSDFDIDAHWTMSCGNDNINGGFSIPEPTMLSLMGVSLLGLGFVRRRKIKA